MEGEFDKEDEAINAQFSTMIEGYRPSLRQIASTHGYTDQLNQLSTEIRDLDVQEKSFDAILRALRATVEAVNARQRDLPER